MAAHRSYDTLFLPSPQCSPESGTHLHVSGVAPWVMNLLFLFAFRYVRLCEVVDHVFPLLKRSHSSDFPCSDTFSNFTFWREPPPPFENQDVHSASA